MPAPEAPRSSAPLASLEAQMTALRYDVALADLAHVTCLRVSGDDAYEALDAVCPADLVLRDGQMLHTLFLRDDGSPLCDVYVCRDDEEFWLLLEGQDGPSAAAHLRAAAPAGLRFDVRELDASHRSLLVSGPYAWELMGELVGPGIVGLPYLSFFLEGDWLCFRAGKTGEFGYHLLGPCCARAASATRRRDRACAGSASPRRARRSRDRR